MDYFDSFTRLRFINCEGLALEQGASMLKITRKDYEVSAESSIAYVLNEKGKILCTIPTSKSDYESMENIDRRKANIENRFTVNWDVSGETCTITYKRPKRNGCLVAGIICLVVFLLLILGVGGFFCYKFLTTKNGPMPQIEFPSYQEETETITEESEVVATDEEATAPTEAPAEESATTSRQDIEARARVYINALQSMECDVFTVIRADNWYDGLSSSEKRATNLNEYIDAYSTFFNATRYEDLKGLNRSYFSPTQQKVIWDGYGRNSNQFNTWKNDFGMSFSIPYKAGLIN